MKQPSKNRANRVYFSEFFINSKGQLVHPKFKRLPVTGVAQIAKIQVFTSNLITSRNS